MIKVTAILRRRWWILLIATLAGVIAGVGSAELGQADGVTLYKAEDIVAANRNAGAATNPPQDAIRVTRGEIAQDAAKRLDRPNADAVAADVIAVFDAESNSISISSQQEDPEQAVKLVSAFSAAFIERMNAELRTDAFRQLEVLKAAEQQARDALAQFDAQFPDIRETPENRIQVQQLLDARRRLLDDISGASQSRLDAEVKLSQDKPYLILGSTPPRPVDNRLAGVANSPPIRGAMLGLLGLLLGTALVFLVERITRPIDTREELADIVDAPILTAIPHVARKRIRTNDDGTIALDGLLAEHYRRIRAAIQFVQNQSERDEGDRASVFLITSSLPGEGKSTTTALTAVALAETGTDTLVVNSDVRRPSVERMLGAAISPSLADRAEMRPDRPDVEDLVQRMPMPHLFVTSGGPPTRDVRPRISVATEVATAAAKRGTTVLIDSTPFAVANDTVDVLPVVDRVILVVRAGQTTRKALEGALETLTMHEARVMGVVFIGLRESRRTYYYYEQYYAMEPPTTGRKRTDDAVTPRSRAADATDTTADTSTDTAAPMTADSRTGSASS